jgi:beta-xylosidase
VGSVRRHLIVAALSALVLSPAALPVLGAPAAQAKSQPPLPSPVMRGDWPDPGVLLDGGSYYAVATSGGWAPTFRILRSTDLRAWSIAGSVFLRPPGWARDSFWAPEMARLGKGYALFYSAFPRKAPGRTFYCLGVATSPSPLGPWRDLGRPLRCTPHGTIDPTAVRDTDGRLYLVYKEDGNAFDRPTPILLQRLRADGRRLIGPPRELIRNRARWEGEVVEAPALVRRGGWWHMVYSANFCCGRGCAYAVGAARSRRLAGPWRRFPGNPILRSGNGWRCPGHVSLIGDKVAFHAYRAGNGRLAGRQMLIADISFAGGWPSIASIGRPPPPMPGAPATGFADAFTGPFPAPEWEWPVVHPPTARTAAVPGVGGLRLGASRRAGSRIDAGVLSRRLGSDRYTATAVIARSHLVGAAVAGLAVVRGGPFSVGDRSIGIRVSGTRVVVWRRIGRRVRTLAESAAPTGPMTHVRIVADGLDYRFEASPDGTAWTAVGPEVRGPLRETARLALTVGGRPGAVAHFASATLTER